MKLPVIRCYIEPLAFERGANFEAPRDGDAGFDLRSAADITVNAGQQIMIPTGLYLEIPSGWVGIIKDRSGMASKGLRTHGGVIDSSYRGEVRVIMSNSTPEPYRIAAGAKIAQLVVVQHLVAVQRVDSLDELSMTTRAAAGFGSTGI